MNQRLKSAQARLKAAEKTIRRIEHPTHKISVRLSADNYARLKGGLWKGKENMSACINHIIKKYFSER